MWLYAVDFLVWCITYLGIHCDKIDKGLEPIYAEN